MMNMQVNDWKIIGIRPDGKKGTVLAECVCGKVKVVRGRSIRTQVSKNCGCKKSIKRRGVQRIKGTDSALQMLHSRYRRTAIRHGREFSLNKEDFLTITSSHCYYCETPPMSRAVHHKYIYYYNGIDRVDNSIGYIKENVVACCTMCNTKKGGITLGMINKIMGFLNDKKP